MVAVDQEIHGVTSVIHQSPDCDHLGVCAHCRVEHTTFPRERLFIAFLKNTMLAAVKKHLTSSITSLLSFFFTLFSCPLPRFSFPLSLCSLPSHNLGSLFKCSPFRAWSGSEYSQACFAHCLVLISPIPVHSSGVGQNIAKHALPTALS